MYSGNVDGLHEPILRVEDPAFGSSNTWGTGRTDEGTEKEREETPTSGRGVFREDEEVSHERVERKTDLRVRIEDLDVT